MPNIDCREDMTDDATKIRKNKTYKWIPKKYSDLLDKSEIKSLIRLILICFLVIFIVNNLLKKADKYQIVKIAVPMSTELPPITSEDLKKYFKQI